MTDLPTLLFTDVQCTRTLERWSPDEAASAIAAQDRLVRASVVRRRGQVFAQTGDGLCAVLPSPDAAVSAAVEAQRTMLNLPWTAAGPVRVRMALHAVHDGSPTDPAAIRRCGHLLSIGHGGQVLLTGPTARALGTAMLNEVGVWLLGSRRRHPLSRAEQVYQLLHADLPATFPPLTSLWLRCWRRWQDNATVLAWRAGRVIARAVERRRERATCGAD